MPVIVPAVVSTVTSGYQDMLIEVEAGKANGSQTYRESFTVPPKELPQRSRRYRYAVPELPCTGRT